MDWAAFFKDYPLVITAVAGLLGIVLVSFLVDGMPNNKENGK